MGIGHEADSRSARPVGLDLVEVDLDDDRAQGAFSMVDAAGKVFLQETEIDIETLVPKLEAIAKNGYEERIFVRGDTSVNYGAVMKVMGALNQAGYKKIGLVTKAEPEVKKARQQ